MAWFSDFIRRTLIFLWVLLFLGCEESHMIRSIMITPEGEATRELGQTTFKVSVKVTHDERDEDGNVVRINVLQPATTPPRTQPTQPRPAEVVEMPVVEQPVVEEPEVSFKNDILPIFKAHCQTCHRHSVRFDPKGGLDLSSYKSTMNGRVFDPGWSKQSTMYWRIRSDQIHGRRMPLYKPPLPAEQIQLILDWIDAGAKDN